MEVEVNALTPTEFEKYLRRDKYCWHCGRQDDTLIIHHRSNRKMGGKNAKADLPANLIVMCAEINGLMESDAAWAATARLNGWKISSFDDPTFRPVYDAYGGGWWVLENDFAKLAAVNLNTR